MASFMVIGVTMAMASSTDRNPGDKPTSGRRSIFGQVYRGLRCVAMKVIRVKRSLFASSTNPQPVGSRNHHAGGQVARPTASNPPASSTTTPPRKTQEATAPAKITHDAAPSPRITAGATAPAKVSPDTTTKISPIAWLHPSASPDHAPSISASPSLPISSSVAASEAFNPTSAASSIWANEPRQSSATESGVPESSVAQSQTLPDQSSESISTTRSASGSPVSTDPPVDSALATTIDSSSIPLSSTLHSANAADSLPSPASSTLAQMIENSDNQPTPTTAASPLIPVPPQPAPIVIKAVAPVLVQSPVSVDFTKVEQRLTRQAEKLREQTSELSGLIASIHDNFETFLAEYESEVDVYLSEAKSGKTRISNIPALSGRFFAYLKTVSIPKSDGQFWILPKTTMKNVAFVFKPVQGPFDAMSKISFGIVPFDQCVVQNFYLAVKLPSGTDVVTNSFTLRPGLDRRQNYSLPFATRFESFRLISTDNYGNETHFCLPDLRIYKQVGFDAGSA
jgi:hypothetical protein